MNKELKDLLNLLGADVVERAKSNLKVTQRIKYPNGKSYNRNRYASGRLYNSLTFKSSVAGGKPFIKFTTKSEETQQYADIVEYGRRAGAKPPPIDPIIEWMKLRKIRLRNSKNEFIKYSDEAQRNAAKRIAYAIGRNGTPGILYYTTAIEEILDERSPAFFQYLNEAISFELDLDGRNKNNQ
jgi:hypothetical protein